MNVVLISTYALGRQPFGLASPAAWLKKAGASVTCQDLAVHSFEEHPVAHADLVAFYVPMHTATRIATTVVERVKKINPDAHLCFYGLYAPVNESFLRKLGVDTILGGEFEQGLVSLVRRLATNRLTSQSTFQQEPLISLARQKFLTPDRHGLPSLSRYARLNLGNGQQRIAGYTEASRGCKHLCRHCPIVPVYGGTFRVVQQDVVLNDISRQIEAGAQHITFGDPDFFNGPGHAIPIVKELHNTFPNITYDVTIKVQHLLKHSQYLHILQETGCLFVTSAVESVDNAILEIFDKHHTKQDFIQAVSILREVGLTLHPTFVTFSPWTSLDGYLDLLTLLLELDLIDNVPPIQYAIRLLIPAGSRLLELDEVQQLVGEFHEQALYYPWIHPDARVDQLHEDILNIIQESNRRQENRRTIFCKVWEQAHQAAGTKPRKTLEWSHLVPKTVPHMSESWYC